MIFKDHNCESFSQIGNSHLPESPCKYLTSVKPKGNITTKRRIHYELSQLFLQLWPPNICKIDATFLKITPTFDWTDTPNLSPIKCKRYRPLKSRPHDAGRNYRFSISLARSSRAPAERRIGNQRNLCVSRLPILCMTGVIHSPPRQVTSHLAKANLAPRSPSYSIVQHLRNKQRCLWLFYRINPTIHKRFFNAHYSTNNWI